MVDVSKEKENEAKEGELSDLQLFAQKVKETLGIDVSSQERQRELDSSRALLPYIAIGMG